MSGPWEISENGWPTSPDHPANRDKRTVEELREAFFQRELRNLREAHQDSNGAALLSAIEWCDRYQRPLPRWAVTAVRAALGKLYSQGKSGARGKLARPADADRQNRIHYERWAWIRDERDPDLGAPGRVVPSLEKAYFLASEALKGRSSGGSPEVMKKSYQLVERLARTGKGGRFYRGG